MEEKNINWEKVRIETAISVMPKAIEDVIKYALIHKDEVIDIPQYSAKLAIEFADALIAKLSGVGKVQHSESAKPDNDVLSLLDLKLYDSSLSVKSINAVKIISNKPAKDVTIGDLIKCSKAELLALRNFGKASLREIVDFLAEYGLKLKGE